MNINVSERENAADRRVPILILNFNGWDDTFATIRTIISHSDPIWLVDNGSEDDRTQEAERLFPGLFTIRIERNLGWAGGYNVAVAEAKRQGFRYVYLLNNDAVPQPGAVEAVLATMSLADDIAAVGSVIVETDGDVWYDGDYVYAPARKKVSDVDPGVRDTKAINGAGFLLNLDTLKSIGSFHEDYFLYHEETDWCVLARRNGWRLLVNGSSFVVHARESSNTTFNSTYYRCRNRALLLKRGTSPEDQPQSRGKLALSQMKQIAQLKNGARFAATHGFMDGWAGRFGPRNKNIPPVKSKLFTVFGAGLSMSYDLTTHVKRLVQRRD